MDLELELRQAATAAEQERKRMAAQHEAQLEAVRQELEQARLQQAETAANAMRAQRQEFVEQQAAALERERLQAAAAVEQQRLPLLNELAEAATIANRQRQRDAEQYAEQLERWVAEATSKALAEGEVRANQVQHYHRIRWAIICVCLIWDYCRCKKPPRGRLPRRRKTLRWRLAAQWERWKLLTKSWRKRDGMRRLQSTTHSMPWPTHSVWQKHAWQRRGKKLPIGYTSRNAR